MATDTYQEITDKIVKSIESGVMPWVKPWASSGAPRNLVTGRHYTGINTLLLAMTPYADSRFLTYKQAADVGAQVMKGEQGTKVVFFKPFNITDKNDADSKVKTIPLLRTFTVFNTDQIENLPEKYTVKNDAPVIEFINNEAADSLLSHAVIEHGGQRACFIPSADKIQLPARESFITVSDYYATALHELTHWTGHKSRLARNFDGRFGSNAYAFEELIAELGAAFFCSSTGIDGKLQHDSYIANWLQVLKGDKRAIFTAASAARKAVELVAGKPEEEAMVLSA